MNNSINLYPYCYKIKDECPPCKIKDNCIRLLSHYLVLKSNKYVSEQSLNNAHMKLGDCLKQYGDMYKKVGIELYVNPKTKEIIFPDNQRITANYNMFLNGYSPFNLQTPKEESIYDEKIIIYQILLNEKLREVYNNFYRNEGFSEKESILPKEYGITRLMGPEIENNGGKRKKKTNKTRKKVKKTSKRRKIKKNI